MIPIEMEEKDKETFQIDSPVNIYLSIIGFIWKQKSKFDFNTAFGVLFSLVC